MTYRVGRHWGVTIVREDLDVAGERDQLVAVVTNGDTALAERICALLNGDAGPRTTHPTDGVIVGDASGFVAMVTDSCTCAPFDRSGFNPDPNCVVHQGRRARGPKPPNPPGCICDGSGRTCPRHGAVI